MALLNDSELPLSLLHFYSTATYPCSYLADRQAVSLVATPTHLIDGEIYGHLLREGFRRSGLFTYRPECPSCQACVPVRLPVDRFVPARSQRRNLKRNAGLRARPLPLIDDDEHYALYLRYQERRHAGGGMDLDDRDQYAHFILQSRIDSRLVEFREDGVLRMVSLIDVVSDGLSSVYTFYDPDRPHAGYGTYGILWQIAQCIANGLPYLYLGYWIRASRKMAYKADFRPIEGYIDGQWREFDPNDPTVG